MSRTKRIYNRRLKKAQRTNLDDGAVHVIHGIPFTKRSWICMGCCSECRDPKNEPRRIRKQNKEEFRIQISLELAIGGEEAFCSTSAPYGLEI